MPLLGYTLLPPTRTPASWPAYTATPLLTVDSSPAFSPALLHLKIIGPACYETPVGSLVCLGQVRNTLDTPVEQIVVEVQLVTSNGTALASREVFVSRHLIPAGSSGPYRVLFEEIPAGYAAAFPQVKNGQVLASMSSQMAELTLRQVSGRFVANQYQIAMSMINRTLLPIERISITMVLTSDEGAVTGFRQVTLDRELRPGEALSLNLKVIPQGPSTVGYEVFAEGFLAVSK